MTSSEKLDPSFELAVILPALNEAANLETLLPSLSAVLSELRLSSKIVVVDGGSTDNTVAVALSYGARVVNQKSPGYGMALLEGFDAVKDAVYVVTMDADLSHRPTFIRDLWLAREGADVVVASRYVSGGASSTFRTRRALSRLLNVVCSRVLSVTVRDSSSGYRLYRRRILDSLSVAGTNFDVLPEILVALFAEGYRIVEVPFQFASRGAGRTNLQLARLAVSYLKTLGRLWRLRNSIESADYDFRAHDSAIWLQRYWQQTRHRIILNFARDGGRILDVGCGSSHILLDLPKAVGVDVLLRKLRFLRPLHPEVVQASIFALPFPGASFDTVICSEVIEHVPDDPRVLEELNRVLKPDGTLVLGTPDYGRVSWLVLEWVYGKIAPGSYAHEHITHFNRKGLRKRLTDLGYKTLDCQYVGFSEMIFKARKAAKLTDRSTPTTENPSRSALVEASPHTAKTSLTSERISARPLTCPHAPQLSSVVLTTRTKTAR